MPLNAILLKLGERQSEKLKLKLHCLRIIHIRAGGEGFVGGPGWNKKTADCAGQTPFVVGAYGGVGGGLFLTNANSSARAQEGNISFLVCESFSIT